MNTLSWCDLRRIGFTGIELQFHYCYNIRYTLRSRGMPDRRTTISLLLLVIKVQGDGVDAMTFVGYEQMVSDEHSSTMH